MIFLIKEGRTYALPYEDNFERNFIRWTVNQVNVFVERPEGTTGSIEPIRGRGHLAIDFSSDQYNLVNIISQGVDLGEAMYPELTLWSIAPNSSYFYTDNFKLYIRPVDDHISEWEQVSASTSEARNDWQQWRYLLHDWKQQVVQLKLVVERNQNSSQQKKFYLDDLRLKAEDIEPVAEFSGLLTADFEHKLSWNYTATSAEQLELQSADNVSGEVFSTLTTLAANEQEYISSGWLEVDTKYRIRVVKGDKVSVWSEEVELPGAPEPGAAQLVTVQMRSATKVDVNWELLPTTTATGYRLERRADGEANFELVRELDELMLQPYTDIDLLPGTTYYYRVVSYTARRERVSNVLSATPIARTFYAIADGAWSSQLIWSLDGSTPAYTIPQEKDEVIINGFTIEIAGQHKAASIVVASAGSLTLSVATAVLQVETQVTIENVQSTVQAVNGAVLSIGSAE